MDTSLRTRAVRSEGRPSCSPVLQALILLSVTPENFGFPGFSFLKVELLNLLAYFFALNPGAVKSYAQIRLQALAECMQTLE